tara:strand:+ start:1152 stop:1301 length:150 start_codon:yes stop_codon:yes gene_type:complete
VYELVPQIVHIANGFASFHGKTFGRSLTLDIEDEESKRKEKRKEERKRK